MLPQNAVDFLSMVLPWDDASKDLYKCVNYQYPKFDPAMQRSPVGNYVAQSFQDLCELADARREDTGVATFITLGTQRNADATSGKLFRGKYLRAIRQTSNMISYRSLWVDIDVGETKPYKTPEEALRALIDFQIASGLPEPSLLVASGSGGFHAYWCTDVAMPAAEWKPLALALKRCADHHKFFIDEKCTADGARFLRLPGSYNWKTSQKVPVDLKHINRVPYTVAELSQALALFTVAQPAQQQQHAGGTVTTPSQWAQNFGAGVTDTAPPPLPIDVIAVTCPMTAATLADGGAGKAEPDWSQDIYLAAWTDDPVDAAHRLSRGHASYTPAETDQKLAEKQAAIASGKLGWPKCAAFNHAACKGCKFALLGKSPLNFAQPLPQQAKPPAIRAYHADQLIPAPYWRDDRNCVFMDDDETGEPVTVLDYPILDGGINSVVGELVLKTSISGRERWGSVSMLKQGAQAVVEALTRGTHGGVVTRVSPAIVKGFVMAWIAHLQDIKRTISPSSYGWQDDNNFVFGDEMYTSTDVVSVFRGSAHPSFHSKGSARPWQDAMALIYGNPPLEVVVASAFAAPLVSMICDFSVVLSVYSQQSGVGKTTALKLALAAWGHPRTGMSTLDDTQNSVNEKISTLRNLPVYWDELKTKDQLEAIVRLVFSVAGGKGKARLDRDSSQREVGTATTLFAVASNLSILDQVSVATEGTNAGGLRVFEIEAQNLIQIRTGNAEQLLIPLNQNYGVVGADYAHWLVPLRPVAEQVLGVIDGQMQAAYQFTPDERYWRATMVSIVAGAMLANTAGLARFNVAAIERCLGDALQGMRGNTIRVSHSMQNTSAEDLLSDLMNETIGKHLIVTDIISRVHGRPGKVSLLSIAELSRLLNVWLQIGRDDGRVTARQRDLDAWLRKRGSSWRAARKIFEQDYFVTERKTTLGVGVDVLAALSTARCLCVELEPKVPPSRNLASPFASPGSPSP